jgi:hypothetical protein
MHFGRPHLWRRASDWIIAGAAVVVAGALLAYRLWGRSLVQRLYDQDGISFLIVPDQIRSRATADECYEWGGEFLVGLVIALIAIALVCGVLRLDANGRFTHALKTKTLTWGFPCLVAATLFVVFQQACVEGPWYRIDEAMAFRVEPPFRHRVLFILVARAIEYATPGLSERQAFFASQLLAAGLAVFATQAWCRRTTSTPLFYFFGLALTALMLAPTFQYYTSYDFGIVFFYAFCLTLLSAKRYMLYVVAAAIGTLNHELIVFLIVLSGVITRAQGKTWTWSICLVLIQLVLYTAIRSALFWLMPVELAWLPGKVWVNIDRLVHVQYLVRTAVLLSWFGIAIALGARSAAVEVRCAILLLPMLIGMTLLVGQINEARQFVAFVPVATVLILACFRDSGSSGLDDRMETVVRGAMPK